MQSAGEVEVESFYDDEDFYSEDEDQIFSYQDENMSGNPDVRGMEEELARVRILGPDGIVEEGICLS